MLKNTAIKIATSKLANASSFLPGTLILVSGLVVWQLWSKQAQLQTETTELSDELKNVKKQIAEIKVTKEDESKAPLSSTFKKFFNR